MDGLLSLTVGFAVAAAWTAVARARRDRLQRTHAADPAALREKLAAVRACSLDRLAFVLDFDRTITTFYSPPGQTSLRGDSCHGVVEKRRGEEVKVKAEQLNKFYYAIEVDPHRSQEEKTPFMRDWYRLVNELLVESGMTQDDLREDVRLANLRLRDGMRQLLDFVCDAGVPLVVFSAGIGDVIAEVLRQRYGQLPPHVTIVSNMMQWEAGGKLEGFSPHILHMFNKSATAMSTEQLALLAGRDTVVLIGDSDGDVTMADGLPEVRTVLRVGLLNDPGSVSKLLPRYASAYDVVHTCDPPCWTLIDIVRAKEAQWRQFNGL